MNTETKEGAVVDRRRFTKEGDPVPENIKPEDQPRPEQTQESFKRQGAILTLMKKIDGINIAMGEMKRDLTQASAELDTLYESLSPKEQDAILERLELESPGESKELIGFIPGKKEIKHHSRPRHIGFIKEEKDRDSEI